MEVGRFIKPIVASALVISSFQMINAEEYTLHAKDARLVNKIKYFEKNEALEYWQRNNSGASWEIEAHDDCDATVYIKMAAPKGYGGVVKVLLDGVEVLTEDVAATGGWSTFKEFDLGDLELTEGEHTIKVLSKKSNKEYFANLKSVILDSEGDIEVMKSGRRSTSKKVASKPKQKTYSAGKKTIVSNGGKLFLKAGTGKVKGKIVFREGSYAWWNGKNSGVEWKVDLKEGGLMDVFALVSGPDHAGGEVEILVDGRSELIADAVSTTGSWDKYENRKLGVMFVKPGKHTVTVRSHSIKKKFFVNMKNLVIKK